MATSMHSTSSVLTPKLIAAGRSTWPCCAPYTTLSKASPPSATNGPSGEQYQHQRGAEVRQSRHPRSLPRDVGELIRHFIPLTKPACPPSLQPSPTMGHGRLTFILRYRHLEI